MIYGHTDMSSAKVAISMEQPLVEKLDDLVKSHVFASRSQAIQTAVKEKLNRMDKVRLSQECSKLDPKIEQALAEEGLSLDASAWPEY